MRNLLTWLSRRRFPYQPLISVEISKGALLNNLAEFQRVAPVDSVAQKGRVSPVLKSNAYGHGLLEVARILDAANGRGALAGSMPFFVVDSYFEAVALHAAGISTPLLVIGYTRPETVLRSRLPNVAFTATNIEMLESLAEARRPIRLHLKIDTGMHRQGVVLEKLDAAIALIKKNPRLRLEGICSHLPDADNADPSFTSKQIALWNSLAARFKKEFPDLEHIHLSATDGHRFSPQISATVSRLGIGLYGLAETESLQVRAGLKPALEMKTIVTGVKRLAAGETVGYGNSFTAFREMTIATVPAGYFEGIDRQLSWDGSGSPKGFILVGPDRIPCPIIGRVSMNIVTIDVSAVPNAATGMTAVIFSAIASDKNSIVSIARACKDITYDIVVKIPAHLKRVVVK